MLRKILKITDNQSGITLTELVVSSALIGIVMVGVVSFNFAVSRTQSSTRFASVNTTRMATALAEIRRDAVQSVGDFSGTTYTSAVQQYAADPVYSICFRYQTSVGGGIGWKCYWANDTTGLWKCNDPVTVIPPTTQVQCQNGGTSTFLVMLTNPGFFTVKLDGSNRLEYVEFNLVTRGDVSTAEDPLTNPEFSVSTRVSPMGISRN